MPGSSQNTRRVDGDVSQELYIQEEKRFVQVHTANHNAVWISNPVQTFTLLSFPLIFFCKPSSYNKTQGTMIFRCY